MLESIFLDFWKDKFIVHTLCFISLFILCLKVEVIKWLLWLPNELAAPFKKGKKWPSTYAFNSSFNFRAREKLIK